MPKYESNTKIARNDTLFIFKEEHLDWGWAEIGAKFGISATRAQYIYRRERKRRQANGREKG